MQNHVCYGNKNVQYSKCLFTKILRQIRKDQSFDIWYDAWPRGPLQRLLLIRLQGGTLSEGHGVLNKTKIGKPKGISSCKAQGFWAVILGMWHFLVDLHTVCLIYFPVADKDRTSRVTDCKWSYFKKSKKPSHSKAYCLEEGMTRGLPILNPRTTWRIQ